MGFNNTGNVCVWPSEEVLAHLVLQNRHLFRDKVVLELGGGMSCFAGLWLAKYAQVSVLLCQRFKPRKAEASCSDRRKSNIDRNPATNLEASPDGRGRSVCY